MEDEFIPEEEVNVSPRGRKATVNAELLATLKKVKQGSAVRLKGTFGEVPKAQRAATSQIIRKHWRIARQDDCRIDYTVEGVAQVRPKPAKG